MIAAPTIERARAVSIESIIAERGIKLRGKNERVGPCPHCGGDDRFAINILNQVWNCRGCVEGGDVIKLVRFLDGVDFREACATLTGKPPSSGYSEAQRGAGDYNRRQRDKAQRLWCASQAATGTPVEVYLRARGIMMPVPPTVRFLPPLKSTHHPAMIVPYGLPNEPEPGLLAIAEDAICAVQLTLLKPGSVGKADVKPNKLTIASPAGAPMVLAPLNDLMGLAITEGGEDALTAHQATGLGAWASGGASFLPKLAAAVPSYCEVVTVFAHADGDGQRGARELGDVLVARGIEVRVEGIAS